MFYNSYTDTLIIVQQRHKDNNTEYIHDYRLIVRQMNLQNLIQIIPNELESWCFCGECHKMKRRNEEICCKKHAASKSLHEAISTYNKEKYYECITEHPGFYYNTVWYPKYWMKTGKAIARVRTKCHRRSSYRNLSRFTIGFMKKHQRMVLPSCAVTQIRETFLDSSLPSYTGFEKRNAE